MYESQTINVNLQTVTVTCIIQENHAMPAIQTENRRHKNYKLHELTAGIPNSARVELHETATLHDPFALRTKGTKSANLLRRNAVLQFLFSKINKAEYPILHFIAWSELCAGDLSNWQQCRSSML